VVCVGLGGLRCGLKSKLFHRGVASFIVAVESYTRVSVKTATAFAK